VTSPPDDAWTCETCGQAHSGLATVFGSDAPWNWHVATAAQRDAGELSADVCFLPDADPEVGTHFFLRGHVELPLREPLGGEDTFSWSVWVSLSGESLALVFEHWDDPDRADTLPPMFGWLCSDLPYEPSTLGLRTQVHTRAPGRVPLVEVEPSGHPLAIEQAEGVSVHRVAELNAAILGELH
jgi:hypothetical protein